MKSRAEEINRIVVLGFVPIVSQPDPQITCDHISGISGKVYHTCVCKALWNTLAFKLTLCRISLKLFWFKKELQANLLHNHDVGKGEYANRVLQERHMSHHGTVCDGFVINYQER